MFRMVTISFGWIAAAALLPAAEPPVPPENEPLAVNRLVANLDHRDLETRERATAQLMVHKGVDETQLRRAFSQRSSSERRNRLIRVAQHRFYARIAASYPKIRDERGALGIRLSKGPGTAGPTEYVLYPSQDRSLPSPALVIAQTIPGFPAFVHLRAGDKVIQINGKPFSDALTDQDFIARLAPLKMDEQIKLRVIRDGETQDVTLRMGSYTQLTNLSINVQYSPAHVEEGMSMFDAYLPWQTYLKALLKSSDGPQAGEV